METAQIEEDMGTWGIVYGCLAGLAKFFCLCHGVAVIYFGKHSSKETKSTKRGCTCCNEGDVVDPKAKV